jgi:hypothetical protein
VANPPSRVVLYLGKCKASLSLHKTRPQSLGEGSLSLYDCYQHDRGNGDGGGVGPVSYESQIWVEPPHHLQKIKYKITIDKKKHRISITHFILPPKKWAISYLLKKKRKNHQKYSNYMFRSCDLRVMSPARFRCAKLLERTICPEPGGWLRCWILRWVVYIEERVGLG